MHRREVSPWILDGHRRSALFMSGSNGSALAVETALPV
jgi:hypothetical protein